MEEGLDEIVVLTSALIHDCIDPKLEPQFQSTKDQLTSLMERSNLSTNQIQEVFAIIENISYSKGTIPKSKEGLVVQDADRLDALGAIGIARAFSFGGRKGRLIYDPTTTDGTDTVSHFYQKLLKLSDLMHTTKGKEEALRRTEYMAKFLQELQFEVSD